MAPARPAAAISVNAAWRYGHDHPVARGHNPYAGVRHPHQVGLCPRGVDGDGAVASRHVPEHPELDLGVQQPQRRVRGRRVSVGMADAHVGPPQAVLGEGVIHGLDGLVSVDLDAGRSHEADGGRCGRREQHLRREPLVGHDAGDGEPGQAAVVPAPHLGDVADLGAEQPCGRGGEDDRSGGEETADIGAVQLGGRRRVHGCRAHRELAADGGEGVRHPVAVETPEADGATVEEGGTGLGLAGGVEGGVLHACLQVAELRHRDPLQRGAGLSGEPRRGRRARRGHGENGDGPDHRQGATEGRQGS